MQVFQLTLNQMLMMFLLIVAGVILNKTHILPENSATTLSRLETYLLVPALNMYNMMEQCTVETLGANAPLMIYGLITIAVLVALSYLLCHVFVKKDGSAAMDYKSNIYKYALAFGNFGFVGNFLVLGIWGQEAFFRYMLFTFPISIVCNSWGLYLMIPKEKGSGILKTLKKGLLTPPIIALIIGAILGLTGLAKYVPSFVVSALESASPCMGPVAMVLAGFVIGSYKFKSLLSSVRVYGVIALRLLILPALTALGLTLFKADLWVITFALVAFAAPIGMNTIVFPAAFGGDTKEGASMVLISNTLAVVTIPLLFLLFQIQI